MNTDDLPEDLRECIDFNGHLCPGLATGCCAAKEGMRQRAAARSEDEEVIAIVEDDTCAVDAIQVLTGATFGKGNLSFRDYGRMAFTLALRRSGRSGTVAVAFACIAALALASGCASPAGGADRRAEMPGSDATVTTIVVEVDVVEGVVIPSRPLRRWASRISQVSHGKVRVRWRADDVIPAETAISHRYPELAMLYADGPEQSPDVASKYLYVLFYPDPDRESNPGGVTTPRWPCGIAVNMAEVRRQKAEAALPALLMHETGHTCGLGHCPSDKCLMHERIEISFWHRRGKNARCCDRCLRLLVDALPRGRVHRGPAVIRHEQCYEVASYPTGVVLLVGDVEYQEILEELRKDTLSDASGKRRYHVRCKMKGGTWAELRSAAKTALNDPCDDVRQAAKMALEKIDAAASTAPADADVGTRLPETGALAPPPDGRSLCAPCAEVASPPTPPTPPRSTARR